MPLPPRFSSLRRHVFCTLLLQACSRSRLDCSGAMWYVIFFENPEIRMLSIISGMKRLEVTQPKQVTAQARMKSGRASGTST